MLLLLRFAMGSMGDWKVPPTQSATLQADRFLIAPKIEAQRKPLVARKPLTKLR